MKQYLELLQDISENGFEKSDRTGTGTKSVFGRQLRFDLGNGFPLLTTKKVHFKSVVHELLWFISGSTNIQYLQENGVTIWDEWADHNGDLGPVYGAQWRNFGGSGGLHSARILNGVDQLANLINEIQTNPDSRRMIVTAWDPASVKDSALPPCHLLYQFNVGGDGRLHCSMYQRSCDVFLGLPFNIASYALLLTMVSVVTGYAPGELIISLGDAHLYLNHLSQTEMQLRREPGGLPRLFLTDIPQSIDDFEYENIKLRYYSPLGPIWAPIAV